MAFTERSASGLPVVQRQYSVGIISCSETWQLRKRIKTLLLMRPEDSMHCGCDAIKHLVRISVFYCTGENKSTKEHREDGVHHRSTTGLLSNELG